MKTLYITLGSPWENGYCESFNGSMRDELLNGKIFYTLAEAKILIETWLKAIAQFDGVTCISRAVADEFRNWLQENAPEHSDRLAIKWFHLGADTDNSVPTTGRPADADQKLALLAQAPSFLAVGTIEPRKGHRQTLAAFDQLWAKGEQANLVFVGKLGWMMDDFAKHLRRHPQYGKRLFWLESISGEHLDEIYAACTVLIAPSEGEGFGLPIVEAARHGLPVLARDIPVV